MMDYEPLILHRDANGIVTMQGTAPRRTAFSWHMLNKEPPELHVDKSGHLVVLGLSYRPVSFVYGAVICELVEGSGNG